MSNILATFEQALGYDPKEPCKSFKPGEKSINTDALKNNPGIQETIKTLTNNLVTDIKNSILRLTSQIFNKDFLIGSLAIVKNFGLAAVIGLYNSVENITLSAVYGTINTIVGLAMNSVQGLSIMLKYLAVKTLNHELSGRIVLSNKLLLETQMLINILNNVISPPPKTREQVGKISDVLTHVTNAKSLIGKEITKQASLINSQLSGTVDARIITQADTELKTAINILTFSTTQQIYEYERAVNEVNSRYQIQVKFNKDNFISLKIQHLGNVKLSPDMFSVDPMVYFSTYLNEIQKETRKRPDLWQYDQPTNKYLRWLNEFLNIASLPNIMKVLIIASEARASMQALTDRLPVISATILNTTLDKLIGKNLFNIQENNIWNYLTPPVTLNSYIPGENIQDWSVKVKTAESVMLGLPSWIVNFNKDSEKVHSNLVSIFTELDQISEELKNEIKNPTDTSSKMTPQRTTWQQALSKVRSELSIYKEINFKQLGVGNNDESIAQIEKQFVNSLIIYEEIRQLISQKLINQKTGELNITYAEQIYDLAQSGLKYLSLGPVIALNTEMIKTLISNLQTLRFLLEKLINQDIIHRSKTQDFLQSVESVPVFGSVIKPSWDAVTNMFENSSIFKNYESLFKNGNAALLAGVVNTTSSVAKCFGAEAVVEMLSDILNKFKPFGSKPLDNAALEQWQKDAQKTIGQLKDKAKMLDLLKSQL